MPYIEHYGTEAQKQKFLPKVCVCVCVRVCACACMLILYLFV